VAVLKPDSEVTFKKQMRAKVIDAVRRAVVLPAILLVALVLVSAGLVTFF
jgi:hypothetical protein